jgi:hypothetical protein
MCSELNFPNVVFVFVPIHIKILNNEQKIEFLILNFRRVQYPVC